ncbi:hypothetical protein LVD15_18760 [Fulvivirga maritima]|uniref:hypothetical protein n=1 Tax=Fulvivirga maritima TaxID=2904247 RepID=UPI001F305D85|nr:hypothetical protein [Fulvivirga maritima]UII25329.1 hypothetical protein LVD15_18760 [Fulvivirga maritima]
MKAVNNILRHLEHFEVEKGYFTGDKVKDKYFKMHTSNNEIPEVILKISAIETEELREIVPDLRKLSSFIVKSKIDQDLKNGDPKVVNKLMSFYEGKEKVAFMTFCSTYCCWHNKDDYPVFNIEAIRILGKYFKRSFAEYLGDYSLFQEDMKSLKEQLGLDSLNFQELEKFFWLFSQDLEEAKVKSA